MPIMHVRLWFWSRCRHRAATTPPFSPELGCYKCYDLTMHAPSLPSSSGVSVTADVGSRSLLNVISMASQPMETQVRSIDLTPAVLMDRLMFPNGHLLSELRVSTSSASRLRPVNVVAWLRTSLSGWLWPMLCCISTNNSTLWHTKESEPVALARRELSIIGPVPRLTKRRFALCSAAPSNGCNGVFDARGWRQRMSEGYSFSRSC